MGSKSARLRKRHELAARRKAAEAKKNRVAAEEARRAALKREAAGQTVLPAEPAAPADSEVDEVKPDTTASVASGVGSAVDESSRIFKRKVKARKLSKTAAGLHESAETLRKRTKKNGDGVDPEIVAKPAGKKGSDKIITKIIAVVAAVATLGSVVIAAFYAA